MTSVAAANVKTKPNNNNNKNTLMMTTMITVFYCCSIKARESFEATFPLNYCLDFRTMASREYLNEIETFKTEGGFLLQQLIFI